MTVQNAHLKNRLALTAIGHVPNTGRWRTEAMRSHETARLLFFARGQGRITVAGLTSGYGPNNLVFIPPHTLYGYELTPMVFGQMLTIPAAMASEWPDEYIHLRLRDVVAQKELALHFDRLERELTSDRAAGSRAAHYHLGLLAVLFERHLDARSDAARTGTASARLVAAYSDLVERDFRTGKGVADYAAELGITPTHLTRCCRETCGKPALSLLNDRILYEARLMLRETKMPVGEIARSLGFSSPAYFTRAFQTAIGATPTAFRRHGAAALPPVRP